MELEWTILIVIGTAATIAVLLAPRWVPDWHDTDDPFAVTDAEWDDAHR